MSTAPPSGHGIEWIVFDLGGVVLTPTRALPALAARIGAPTEDFVTAYYAHRRDYDRLSDPDRYWSAVAASCGAAAPDAALTADLVALDDRGWSETDPAMLDLVERLRPSTPLAVLSNAPTSMGTLVRRQPWAGSFRHILISGDLGIVKPEPDIFATLLATVDSPAERVIFIDDRADNVAAAADCGIRAVRFAGADPLRAWLAERGIPGTSAPPVTADGPAATGCTASGGPAAAGPSR